MEVEQGRTYGVVSGDVVASSKLPAEERRALFDTMRAGSDELGRWLGEAMPLEVDIHGGDSWQMLLADPQKSLAAGLFYRAYLKAHPPHVDSRFAVAVGPIDFVPGEKVSEGDGLAFRQSGELLAEGLGKRRMGFASETNECQIWDLVLELLDAIVQRWTEKQALAITGALRGWTQEETARLWDPPVEQPTIHRQLQAARWPAVARAVEEFERRLSG